MTINMAMKRFAILAGMMFLAVGSTNVMADESSVDCAAKGINDLKQVPHQRINSLKEVVDYMESNHLPKDRTLVVFDIDDTILESDRFVGGDSWYRWQTWRDGKQPVYDTKGTQLVVAKGERFPCIYSSLSTHFNYGTASATEASAPGVVNKLSDDFDLMLLTSRSPYYREGTERELEKNGFKNLSDEQSIEPLYFVMDGRPVVYRHGIAMSSGLDKGVVLKLILNELLKRVGKQYEHVVFVDDGFKNLRNMNQALETTKIQRHLFFYTHVNKCISQEQINQSNDAKKAFMDYLKLSYGVKGYDTFLNNKCE